MLEQDAVHPVFDHGLHPYKRRPVAQQLPQVPDLPRRDIRGRHEVGPQQVREDRAVNLVSFHLGLGNRPRAQRMR